MMMVASRRRLLAAAIALLALAAAYQIKGNVDLIAGETPGSAVDLRNRDMEQAYFAAGKNPHDYMEGTHAPWAYPFGALLTWPEWPAVRVYWAALNLVALAFLMWWAYRQPRDATPEARLLLAGAAAAFGGACTATEVGQVSIIVTALLAGALWLDAAGRPYWCGLLVGCSMIKPTIAAPFALALIAAGRYRAAAAAAGYGVAATAATWLLTGTAPFIMIEQMSVAAARYVTAGTLGLVDLAVLLGASHAAAVWLPLLIAVPALVLMAAVRPSLSLCFAIAAVWGRNWTYHKSYDDVMLVFLLIPLGVLAVGSARSRTAAIAFFAIGVLAWIPGRLLALDAIQLAQLAAWPAALLVLVGLSSREVVLGRHFVNLRRTAGASHSH